MLLDLRASFKRYELRELWKSFVPVLIFDFAATGNEGLEISHSTERTYKFQHKSTLFCEAERLFICYRPSDKSSPPYLNFPQSLAGRGRRGRRSRSKPQEDDLE
jgi:hypothetical protein